MKAILLTSLIFFLTTGSVFAYDPLKFPGKGSFESFNRSLIDANQGRKLMKQGRYKEALKFYDKAISIYSLDAGMHSNRATILGHLNRPAEAVVEMKKATALAPDWSDGFNNLADKQKAIKDFRGAEESCREAMRLAPNDPLPILTLSEVYIEMGKKHDAQKLIFQASEMPGAKDPFIQDTIKVDKERLSRFR